ncbi:MAG TPA: hypothetical protein VF203_06120 [Burkholderiales bacterium]
MVSDRIGPYQQVADALRTRLERATVYVLEGDLKAHHEVIRRLRDDEGVRVIAIGPPAARAAAAFSGRVVFCQYFYPDLSDGVTRTMRGVRATPPALKQLQAWKLLDPQLHRVLLVAGPGAREFVREAEAAAARLGIALDVNRVASDRELLYVTKRLAPEVQGIWILPDYRVLSIEALRETLAHALRHGRQTLVFNQQLLEYGGLLSAEGDPEDIAERVLEQLRAGDAAPRIAPLTRARVSVNLRVAQQLGLAVPEPLRGGVYVF